MPKPKRESDDENMIPAGKDARFYCNKCETEFEIVHEPKAKEEPKSAAGMEAKGVKNCPFCVGTVEDGDVEVCG